MKAATIHQLKKELVHLSHEQLMALTLRLAKYKKDNKELLTYLLFEAQDESEYIRLLKEEVGDQFDELPKNNLYYLRKGLRKIIRNLDRHIRYSGNKETELEMRMFLCKKIQEKNIPFRRIQSFQTIYFAQVKKMDAALKKLHEDLQHDYLQEINALR